MDLLLRHLLTWAVSILITVYGILSISAVIDAALGRGFVESEVVCVGIPLSVSDQYQISSGSVERYQYKY